ncbi:probable RNA-binding protein EIF1AD [Parasteatoda tepidariorum]|uniref:Probable RNA-binding protein EIF1AD n=1 Tax=Parasteatoda tepidariorum TaxID=114398 RepID=A0A2L2Y285_PARTP|nr:probable RNA-binding protein EIF1AD [Parasteatoda tepidariorum]
MSSFTKKKHVTEEVLNSYDLPASNQSIVKIVGSRGNNLHEILTPKGDTFLVSMPNKFRKHVWIKRGDFVIIEPIVEGDKVKGEIMRVLLKDQILYFQQQSVWPEQFSEAVPQRQERQASNSNDELFINTNRPYVDILISSSDSDASEEEESDTESCK